MKSTTTQGAHPMPASSPSWIYGTDDDPRTATTAQWSTALLVSPLIDAKTMDVHPYSGTMTISDGQRHVMVESDGAVTHVSHALVDYAQQELGDLVFMGTQRTYRQTERMTALTHALTTANVYTHS